MNNMFYSESQSVSEKKKREIMEEIIKGEKAAIELKILLQKPSESEPLLSYHQLVASVLSSFTQSLSIIYSSSSSEPSSADGVPHRNLLNPTGYISPETGSGNDPTSGHCSEKRSQKGGRGRYIRRLTSSHFLFLDHHTLLFLITPTHMFCSSNNKPFFGLTNLVKV